LVAVQVQQVEGIEEDAAPAAFDREAERVEIGSPSNSLFISLLELHARAAILDGEAVVQDERGIAHHAKNPPWSPHAEK
jgi:hypothetical protein